jgi:hypothetical protein
MTNTSKAPVDQTAAKASAASTTTGKPAPPRDAAPGAFGGFTMIKDRVAGVVRKLTGGS